METKKLLACIVCSHLFFIGCQLGYTPETTLSKSSQYQMLPGTVAYNIFQKNKIVGYIYVPSRPTGSTQYDEHWILLPDYIYPGPKHPQLKTMIAQGTKGYTSKEDFFQKVPFPSGSRYILVKSYESNQLPK